MTLLFKLYLLANRLENLWRKLELRDIDEILDEADLIYRYDWACVDARMKQLNAPAGLNSSVVVERHGALIGLYSVTVIGDDPDVNT